jgi:hypothetical protein
LNFDEFKLGGLHAVATQNLVIKKTCVEMAGQRSTFSRRSGKLKIIKSPEVSLTSVLCFTGVIIRHNNTMAVELVTKEPAMSGQFSSFRHQVVGH